MPMPVAEGISELKWVWFAKPRLLSDMDEFDLASRGPRGSFRFIFRLPQNKLACLGAMITLLSLGLDPFTQLVVQTYDCLTIGPGLATINRTNNYTAHGPGHVSNWRVDAPMGLGYSRRGIKSTCKCHSKPPFRLFIWQLHVPQNVLIFGNMLLCEEHL